jgi:putative permease
MLAHAQDYVRTLPEKYPEIIDVSLVETIIDNIRQRILTGGEQLVSASLSSSSTWWPSSSTPSWCR